MDPARRRDFPLHPADDDRHRTGPRRAPGERVPLLHHPGTGGDLLPGGFSPTKIYVTEDYVRAVPGGTGYCKAGGNYAASLYAGEIAKGMGYTQVLWLDAIERKYVEEVGTSNMFFVIGDELITAPLTGTILPGVTRDSVIHLAKSWG